MDQCTHEVRSEYWKGIIKACGQRPAGQTAKSWMEENGICEQSYYSWQRKFRRQAYEQMEENKASVPAVPEKGEISFVEIPCYPEGRHDKKDEAVMMECPVAVIRTSKLRIEITNGISDSLLSHILSGVSHA